MTQRAFCFRLRREDDTVTQWLAYQAIEFDGRMIRIVLADAVCPEIVQGEMLQLETEAAVVPVVLRRVIDDEVIVLSLLDEG